MSLARAMLSGTLLGDPERRYTPNNHTVTSFSIQVQPVGRNESPFVVRVTCWRGLADVAAETLHKGDDVIVEGRLQINQYEGQGGVAKRTFEIDASNLYRGTLQPLAPALEAGGFTSRQSQSYNNAAAGQPVSQGMQQPIPAGVGAAGPDALTAGDLLTEDDIPF